MAKLPPERQRFLDDMNNFIKEEERWLQEIMNYMGWNIEDLAKITQTNSCTYELCPINDEHRVPLDSMEAHISKCWKKHGRYPEASLDASSLNDDSASTSRNVDLSSLKPSNECSTVTSGSSTSLIELLTAERDAKRRRATYRKKGVSTNKKSYNEVLRELIDNEMKTLEFGLKTDDESGSSLTSANEERAAKKSVYAGVGNWIYNGNPYKRWMTIEDEEQNLLKCPSSIKTDKTESHSTYPANRSHHSHEDRRRGHEYSDRSPRRQERFRSRRYDHHFDDSSRYERSHSDRHKRNLFEDRSKRHEQTHFSHSEHRHLEERRRSDFSSRQGSVYGAEISKRERSSRRSPSRDHKRYKYDEDFERMSNKSSKSYVNRESCAASKSREKELTENLIENVEDSRLEQSPSKFDLKNESSVSHDDISKHEGEAKLSNSKRHSSSSSDVERKHHKKKKKHKKKSKKKKKERNSSQSSS